MIRTLRVKNKTTLYMKICSIVWDLLEKIPIIFTLVKKKTKKSHTKKTTTKNKHPPAHLTPHNSPI